ncbi:MAG: glycosyltransferase [Tissierellia bacterium]|nr:glycosyltransferase [Tissierellia bacterium]
MCASEIKRAVNSFKPDIIHAHDVRVTVLTAMVSGKIPFISHLHVNNTDMQKPGLKPFLYMFAVKRAKKLIVVSESCLSQYIFKKQIEEKTIHLRNIVYTPRIERLFTKDPLNYKFDFAYIGRISYPKNPERVARVASSVLKLCPDAKFGVIGDGELRSEMEVVFRKEGVIERVVFTGNLPYPYKALKQAKCMLMCSRYEGTPIVALEAMTLGVPIVSTPVDGLNEIISDGFNGYLSDDDARLCSSVVELIVNLDMQRRCSLNAIKVAQHINNISNYKNTLISIYDEAIQNNIL